METYLTTIEVSKFLGIPVQTLKSWRGSNPQGPEYMKLGQRIVRYPKSSLEKWLAKSVVNQQEEEALWAEQSLSWNRCTLVIDFPSWNPAPTTGMKSITSPCLQILMNPRYPHLSWMVVNGTNIQLRICQQRCNWTNPPMCIQTCWQRILIYLGAGTLIWRAVLR